MSAGTLTGFYRDLGATLGIENDSESSQSSQHDTDYWNTGYFYRLGRMQIVITFFTDRKEVPNIDNRRQIISIE